MLNKSWLTSIKKFDFYKTVGIVYIILWEFLRIVKDQIYKPEVENAYVYYTLLIGPFIVLALYVIFIYGFIRLSKLINKTYLKLFANLFFYFSIIMGFTSQFLNILEIKSETFKILYIVLNGILLILLGISIFKNYKIIGGNSKALSIFIIIIGFLQSSYILFIFAFILHIFLIITTVVFYSKLHKVHEW